MVLGQLFAELLGHRQRICLDYFSVSDSPSLSPLDINIKYLNTLGCKGNNFEVKSMMETVLSNKSEKYVQGTTNDIVDNFSCIAVDVAI